VTGERPDTALRQSEEDRFRNTTTRYGYDFLNRLTEARTTGSRTDTYAYDYDAASNRTSLTHNGVQTTYDYDAGNELIRAGTTTYAYDANGSLTSSSAGLQLSYDAADRTVSVAPPGAPALDLAYADAGQSERTRKGTTTYHHTALGITGESGGPEGTSGFQRDSDGRLVLTREGGATYYYLTDALGSVVALTDAVGDAVARHRYDDPFGADVVTTGAVYNPWRFAGEYLDAETGLYKIGERYYDPTVGRWMQQDPAKRFLVADARQANAYTYAGNDPVNFTDPNGCSRRKVIEKDPQ
jgi:RHS repeat-associated protein